MPDQAEGHLDRDGRCLQGPAPQAVRVDDLATALRLDDEFGIGLATVAYLMADEITPSRAPVLVHPTM